MSTGDVHSLPSPFCLTVTGIGWILPKSSQKEKQVLGLLATSAPRAQGPSQGQDVRAPGLWDAAPSVSSLEAGSKACANSSFSPFITKYKQRRCRWLICSAQSGTVVGLSSLCCNELSLVSSWHCPGAHGNVQGLSSACPSPLVEAERRLSPTVSPLSLSRGKQRDVKGNRLSWSQLREQKRPQTPACLGEGSSGSQSSPSSTALLSLEAGWAQPVLCVQGCHTTARPPSPKSPLLSLKVLCCP